MSSKQDSLFRPERRVDADFLSDSKLVLHAGEACAFLESIPDKCVTLVVTSPPYNVGKSYETKTTLDHYLEEQQRVIRELHRVLSDDGSICWNVGNFIERGEIFPLDILFYPMFKSLDMHLRNRVIWRVGHGVHEKKRFSGRYETICWFTKTDFIRRFSVRIAPMLMSFSTPVETSTWTPPKTCGPLRSDARRGATNIAG